MLRFREESRANIFAHFGRSITPWRLRLPRAGRGQGDTPTQPDSEGPRWRVGLVCFRISGRTDCHRLRRGQKLAARTTGE
jgi:hypothetical protein